MKKAIATVLTAVIVIASLFSASLISASAATLKTPIISKTESVSNGVKLTWNKVAGAAKYRIFIKSGSRWKKLSDTKSTTWTDKTAKTGKTYTYTVRCISANGNRFTSSYNKSGVTVKNLAIPRISKFAGVGNGTKITWNKVAGADRYRVFVKENGKWKTLANTTANYYINNNLVNNKSYTYTVRCLSKNGKAFTSYYKTAGDTAAYNSTPVITDIKSTKDGLQLTWQKTNDQTVYRIFVKNGNSWAKLIDTLDNHYTDYTVEDGKAYTYTVRCIAPTLKYYTSDYNRTGTSATHTLPAETVDPTEPTEPIKPTEQESKYIPTITKTELDGNKIKFSWNKIKGIFAYAVYYKNGASYTLLDDEVQIDSYPFSFDKAGDYTFAVIACDPSDDQPHVAPEKAQFTVTIKYVVDQAAYSYEKPITEQVAYCCCNKCGADVTGKIKDCNDQSKIDEWYEKYLVYVQDKYWQQVKSKDEFASDWDTAKAHSLLDGCSGGWHTDYKTVITGYETVNVPEAGHFEIA